MTTFVENRTPIVMEQYRELHIRELRKLIPGQTINDNLAEYIFLAELS